MFHLTGTLISRYPIIWSLTFKCVHTYGYSIELSKAFKVNALGMRKLLTEGTTMEVILNDLVVMITLMDRYDISYKIENYEDCRLKYPFYKAYSDFSRHT